MKLYKYVGSDRLRLSVINSPLGCCIKSVADLIKWLEQTKQKPNNYGLIPATFVIDSEAQLRLMNRHCEHVACAGGLPVFSAGEIFFSYHKHLVEVVEITNQSTGYCPESNSWEAVTQALDLISLSHPGKFTTDFVFRRCLNCGQLNIIKDNLFLCAVCDTPLPTDWNCDLTIHPSS